MAECKKIDVQRSLLSRRCSTQNSEINDAWLSHASAFSLLDPANGRSIFVLLGPTPEEPPKSPVFHWLPHRLSRILGSSRPGTVAQQPLVPILHRKLRAKAARFWYLSLVCLSVSYLARTVIDSFWEGGSKQRPGMDHAPSCFYPTCMVLHVVYLYQSLVCNTFHIVYDQRNPSPPADRLPPGEAGSSGSYLIPHALHHLPTTNS